MYNHVSLAGQKVVFLIQMLLMNITFGGRCNRPFRDVRLKILRLLNVNMLFPLVLTKVLKSELFSCLPKFDHVIKSNIKRHSWALDTRTQGTAIERFHSRDQHLCKFTGTNERICKRKEGNSQRTALEHQHGRRFIVLEHQLAAATACENALYWYST